jgi:Tol biopolymer transport system component
VAGGALALSLVRHPEQALTVGKRIAVAVGPAAERWPSLSPDGKTVVFTRNDRGLTHLYVQQVDGGVPVAVTTQLPEWQCCGAVSPDGSRLLFLAPEGLYIVPTLGGQARVFVSGTALPRGSFGLLWGAWSPDGQKVAYTAGDTLYVRGVDDPAAAAIARGEALHSPAWSSDGRWIAVVRGNPGFHINGNLAPSAITLVPATGGTPALVSDSTALNMSPVWLPGRNALLFISDKDGGRDVYELALSSSGKPAGVPVRITTGLTPDRIAISADGKRLAWSVYGETANVWSVPIPARDSVPLSQATEVTSGNQTIETATVSPDGKWLYYDSDITGNADIWRVALAGTATVGAPEQLTSDPAGDFHPSVSPDGREVAFHSFRTGNRDAFVIPASGGPAVQVTTSLQHEWNPQWSPDGRALAFDEQTRRDSNLWIVRRRPDGGWETPRALAYAGPGSLPAWSPDGRSVSFNGDSGVRVIEVGSGRQHLAMEAGGGAWTSWSRNGRTIYCAVNDSLQRFSILAAPAAGGAPKTLVYSDAPDRQLHRYGFAVADGRFYFTLSASTADVWVADAERK